MSEKANMAARYEHEIPEGYEARIDGNKVIIELKESEDERIRTRLIALVEAFGQGKYKNEMLAYLEKQKEQKPAEWSEEEKGILLECISALQNSSNWLLADKLKSLRPRPHWKPSEVQMCALKYASTYVPDDEGTLAELYEQLKKFASLQQDQPESELEKAARYVYESWMGGTMDDVRRDMVELGKALNARGINYEQIH